MAESKTEYESVKMDDGRIIDFPGKTRLQKESFEGPDGSLAVRMDFRNGETRTFTLPPTLMNKFALHGAEQKLGDEIAGVKDIEDAVMAIDELCERLNNGEWSVRREASGIAGMSVLARALVEVMGKPIDKVKEYLKTKTQAQKIALRNNPRVRPVIERIEAERSAGATRDIDSNALLAELE